MTRGACSARESGGEDYYVYVIFRPSGVPCYVGMGRAGRWMEHHRMRNRHPNKHLQAIMLSSSDPLPVVKVRQGLTRDEAVLTEVAFISAIGRETTGGPLINQTRGGDGVIDKSPEALRRMGDRARAAWGRPGFRERHAAFMRALNGTPEARSRLAERARGNQNNLGKKRSPESRQKSSESRLKMLAENPELAARLADGRRNFAHTPETRAKISATMSGVQKSEATRAKMREAQRRRFAASGRPASTPLPPA